MPKREPRIDAYIAKAAPFARPILEHLREVIHTACPEVEEAMKWSMPFFDHHGPLCALPAFKAHCAFRLWKGDVLQGHAQHAKAMEHFDHLTRLEDLPSEKVLVSLLHEAMKLNEGGVKAEWQKKREAKRKEPAAAVKPPAELVAALKKNAKARATWEGFSHSHRREYAEWIAEAKREETRAKRVAQTLEQLEQGKSRHWKYA
jgi:uncharacterized protein YdeI (YjbR/CyaY-like superfamily)